MPEDFDFVPSGEHEFVHCFGVNKGFTILPNKILRCLFLSSDAKIFYLAAWAYAHGKERRCWPCQTTLRMNLRCSISTIRKYLDELRQKGFLYTEFKGQGSTLKYEFVPWDKIPLLYHSEMLYAIEKQGWGNGKDGKEEFLKLLMEYENSHLFQQVIQSDTPQVWWDEIRNWFTEAGGREITGELNLDDINDEEFEEEPKEEVKKEVKKEEVVYQKPNRELPKTINDNGVKHEAENGKLKPTARNYRDLEPKYWNSNHLVQYFCVLYEKEFGYKYPGFPAKDLGIMKRLVEVRGNSELIKLYIENYMNLKQYPMKTIEGFCSSPVQAKLDAINKDGEQYGEPTNEVIKPIRDSGFDDRYYKG